jgi:hypothetical protein
MRERVWERESEKERENASLQNELFSLSRPRK